MTRSLIARRTCAALLVGLTTLLSACLGGGGSGGGNAQLRVLNVTNDVPSLDVSLSGTKTYTAVATQGLTASSTVAAQSYTVGITVAGSPTSLFSSTYSLAKDQHYTGVVWGSSDALHFNTLPEDENDSLASGTTEVRVFNATANAGAFDVYLTPLLQNVPDLNGAAATRSNVASSALSGYALLATGSYRLRITGAGNPSDVRLDVPSVTLGDVQYATIIITAGTGNALVNATVLVQQSTPLTAFNNGQARIRVVASVQINSDSTRSAIGVQLDGVDVVTGCPAGSPCTLRSPVVGPYEPVASGNHTVAVSLNGTVYSTTTQSLAPGGDYTLMAYGSQASPKVVLIPDNNSVPVIGKVQIRMINGDDTAGPVTLLVDSGNLAIYNVLPGGASDYNLYNSTTSSTTAIPSLLEVYSQDASTFGALYTKSNQTLLSQGVYTVFLLRGGLSPTTGLPASTGQLSKDR
jgi:hypothetical protein